MSERREILEIADELRGLATTGLHFTDSAFDRERYQKLMQLAARLAALEGTESAAELEAIFREGERGYATPKLDVRLAIFRSDEVLLVREVADGLWCLPGGYIDVGESPAEAASREALEEAGVATRVKQLVGIFDNRVHPQAPPHMFHIHKLVFLGELLDARAVPTAQDETTAAGFHSIGALPDLSLGRTLPLHVELALRAAHKSDFTPYFD